MSRRLALTAALAAVCMCSSFVSAQTTEDPIAIRVESNLVVLQVAVVNKAATHKFSAKYQQCALNLETKFHSLLPSQPYLPGDCNDWMIYGLKAADFRVFEDGVEQKVRSAELEPDADITARDNLGWHDEWSHTPRGKWSTADVSGLAEQTLHLYTISYVPSAPAEGKCHNIEVKVDKASALVFAPTRYCYIARPSTDPLRGTELGERLESDLKSDKKAKIPLLSNATYTVSAGSTARVDIVLEFPWDRLSHRWVDGDIKATIGVLGAVYDDKQSIVIRFSDTANAGVLEGMHVGTVSGIDYDGSTPGYLPSRYETQIDVPPGKYELRLVLSDGKKFGRANIPLTIDKYEDNQLALSPIVLFKRFRPAAPAAEEAAAVHLTPEYVPLVSQSWQITPTADTEFSRKELVPVYFEVYDPPIAQRPTLEVQAHVRLVSAKTGIAKNFAWFNAAEFRRAGTTTFAIAKAFPVDDLRKGKYRLEIQARDSAGRMTPWRTTSFSLR